MSKSKLWFWSQVQWYQVYKKFTGRNITPKKIFLTYTFNKKDIYIYIYSNNISNAQTPAIYSAFAIPGS